MGERYALCIKVDGAPRSARTLRYELELYKIYRISHENDMHFVLESGTGYYKTRFIEISRETIDSPLFKLITV